MRVLVAPDSFGGTLTSRQAAEAIAEGWRRSRPDDDLSLVPMADGGEGTIRAVAGPEDDLGEVEVADPLGRPTLAHWLLRADGTAVVESAEACGLALLDPAERDPMRTTTYGVGQLLTRALEAAPRQVVVGLGGSATVDGGAGALTALGLRVLRDDGRGLKIGGGELDAVGRVERGWLDDRWVGTQVVLWSDVTTPLVDAAERFGPQKGADDDAVRHLGSNLERWAEVVERDLGGAGRHAQGSGAAGGLGFGLAAALDAPLEPGAASVARMVGLPEALRDASLVVTGEGRLDRTSGSGKVVGTVLEMATGAGLPVVAVVGQVDAALPALDDLEAAAPEGPGDDPASELAAATAALAGRRR